MTDQVQPSPRLTHPNLALLTCDHVAELLCVSRRTVEKIIDDGSILSVRIGRRVLVRPSDLQKYEDSL